jgi:uncharacterized membrane protein YcaP (DUF421 family)
MQDWFITSFGVIIPTIISAIIIYAVIIAFTRLFGLRSFSKMSSFDFAMTIAVGTILSSTIISKDTSVWQGITALFMLYLLQTLIAWLRRKSEWVSEAVDNDPLLLMRGSEILHDNLKKSHLSESDLRAKLREANVINLSQVKAVIFETTGDISVLHSDRDDVDFDVSLLQGVEGSDLF